MGQKVSDLNQRRRNAKGQRHREEARKNGWVETGLGWGGGQVEHVFMDVTKEGFTERIK